MVSVVIIGAARRAPTALPVIEDEDEHVHDSTWSRNASLVLSLAVISGPLCANHRGRSRTCRRDSRQDVRRRRSWSAGGRSLRAARRRTVSGDARRPRRRWRVGHRAQLAPIAAAWPSTAIRPWRSVIASPRPAVPRADLRLPGGRALDARACRRSSRSTRSESAAFGYSAGGQLVALLGTLTTTNSANRASRPMRPSAGCRPCSPAVRRAIFADCRRQSDAVPIGWAARAAKAGQLSRRFAGDFITADDPPMFFFHGEDDELVPITSPRRDGRAAQRRGMTTEIYTDQEQAICRRTDRDAL